MKKYDYGQHGFISHINGCDHVKCFDGTGKLTSYRQYDKTGKLVAFIGEKRKKRSGKNHKASDLGEYFDAEIMAEKINAAVDFVKDKTDSDLRIKMCNDAEIVCGNYSTYTPTGLILPDIKIGDKVTYNENEYTVTDIARPPGKSDRVTVEMEIKHRKRKRCEKLRIMP